MPLGFAPEAIETGLNYVPRDDDIFVVSYPKSGTTWLQYIVYLLIHGRPIAATETLGQCFPHLEEVGSAVIEARPGPRLIKTHLDRARAPWSARARYLLIARNPFDCAVSFFHHTRGFPRHYEFADGSFSDFFECFVRGEVDFGGYFDHFLSWCPEIDAANVLFLTYEGLSQDPATSVHRIADFLSGAAADRVSRPGALEAVLAEASLESMRQNQQRWSSPRPEWAPGFVRQGAVGGWRAEFAPREAGMLLAEFERRLSGTVADRLWPDIVADARRYAAQQDSDRP